MRGLPSFLSLFLNEINKVNNTGARIVYSFYQMTLKLLLNLIYGVKKLLLRNVVIDVITFLEYL